MASSSLMIELTRRWNEPHRRYHTLLHVSRMLHFGRRQGLSDEQLMAIWFHDAVYVPGAADNEDRSAELVRQLLSREGWSAPRVALVERIVMDTKPHLPTCDESKIVIDLDLMTLAGKPEQFDYFSRQVRAELPHLTDAQWAEGQGAWIDGMLERPNLYWTPWGERFEASARANLVRERANLRELAAIAQAE